MSLIVSMRFLNILYSSSFKKCYRTCQRICY